MHTDIFSTEQIELLPYLKKFKRSFFMVGGTAIALHIGHRRSIDFDLFTNSEINKSRIKKSLLEIPFKQMPVFEDYDQLHLMINKVKLTFFHFPYNIPHSLKLEDYITIPDLLTLAAMKAFALGRRSKWKDYVDLYFIIRDYYSIEEISNVAEIIFPQQFSEKLFRQQLAYHIDIDYTEAVDFLIKPIPDREIKDFLLNAAVDIF
jgi:hypothetical protein